MKKVGRQPLKRQFIVNELRGKIISGKCRPGSRMPTRRKVVESYDATLMTVQQAFDQLSRDGFIVCKGRKGTFVADHPPHLNQFALVFPVDIYNNDYSSRFWSTLAEVAMKVTAEQGVKLSIYNGINKNRQGRDFQRLLDDVNNGRLAGIIFSTSPYLVDDTPIVDKAGIPRVAITSSKDPRRYLSRIVFDHDDFDRKAVSFIKESGCSRAAVLTQNGITDPQLPQLLEQNGIECPYQYQQSVSLDCPEWAKNVTRLLFDAGNTQRPDALIITDDNLFDHAVDGIIDAGLRLDEDIIVLTHSNFPCRSNRVLPVTRLGYDMEALLTICLDEMERQRQGRKPRTVTLDTVFEDEIDHQSPKAPDMRLGTYELAGGEI